MTTLRIYRDVLIDNYASTDGRVGFEQFWIATGMHSLVTLAAFLAVAGLSGVAFTICWGALRLLVLFSIPPFVSAAIRRLHDRGLSGTYALLALVPIVGGVLIVMLLARPTGDEPNRFGVPSERLRL